MLPLQCQHGCACFVIQPLIQAAATRLLYLTALACLLLLPQPLLCSANCSTALHLSPPVFTLGLLLLLLLLLLSAMSTLHALATSTTGSRQHQRIMHAQLLAQQAGHMSQGPTTQCPACMLNPKQCRPWAQGNRETIDGMAGGSAKVIQQVLKLVDGYDLYGSVAYPKRHTQADISDIYRLPLATRGVFTNVALQEPFGLTVIEARPHAQLKGLAVGALSPVS